MALVDRLPADSAIDVAPLKNGRIVVVGASLAGLRAAETRREEGFAGELTMVGEELRLPYNLTVPETRPDRANRPARRHAPRRLRRTEESVAWRYLADRCGSGRWARLLTEARAERDRSGKDGCLPEPRIFSSNCSRDLRISLT
jgi:hypothetical protein